MAFSHTTAAVQDYLDELAGMASSAPPTGPLIRALLGRSVGRLQMLCSVMLNRKYSRLMQPPLNLDVDELLSSVIERLLKAMQNVRPGTTRHFFALANQHIRWELNDLARRLDTQKPSLELRESWVPAPAESTGSVPGNRVCRILDVIASLPDDEREAFDLVKIQGFTQAEAASVLNVSPKTVQRRVNRSLLLLSQALGDLEPETKQA